MKSPHSESRSEMLLKEGLSRPVWLGDATLEEQIVGTLWGRLAKGLQKDHTGKIQVSPQFVSMTATKHSGVPEF